MNFISLLFYVSGILVVTCKSQITQGPTNQVILQNSTNGELECRYDDGTFILGLWNRYNPDLINIASIQSDSCTIFETTYKCVAALSRQSYLQFPFATFDQAATYECNIAGDQIYYSSAYVIVVGEVKVCIYSIYVPYNVLFIICLVRNHI